MALESTTQKNPWILWQTNNVNYFVEVLCLFPVDIIKFKYQNNINRISLGILWSCILNFSRFGFSGGSFLLILLKDPRLGQMSMSRKKITLDRQKAVALGVFCWRMEGGNPWDWSKRIKIFLPLTLNYW